ncbi:MAG TPA: 4Fe-4S binding protein [Lachnospiraceae bacterium]|nr:4Fe-4S binding protein [Lachnospiraceae bacterium]
MHKYMTALTAEERKQFSITYSVPDKMNKFIPRLFTDREIHFALGIKESFGKEQCPEEFLKQEYQRGFISLTDDTRKSYRLSGYAVFMDVYVVREYDDYISRFKKEERMEIDDCYFHRSFDPKAARTGYAPSEDEVLTLDETLELIERHDGPIFLNPCDCRSFAGDCGKPRLTCVTYRGGINTYADRGISVCLTKEEARRKEIEFDRAGLMHTFQGNTICNCCGDCCYLSRGRKIIGSGGSWPKSHHIIRFFSDRCLHCGLCEKRCWKEVFQMEEAGLHVDRSKCIGCGLCVNSCPGKALMLEEHKFPTLRKFDEEQQEIKSH